MEPWSINLFKRSVVKQVKFHYLKQFLGDYKGKRCLDLGSDNGVISYVLRLSGGQWASADIEDQAVDSIRNLVGSDVHKISETNTPFADEEFDLIAIVDLLEHVHADRDFLKEIDRILKKGATLIVNVPNKKRFSILRSIRNFLGLTDEQHGHVREGYTFEEIKNMLPGYQIERKKTYSKLFLELIDIMISFAFHKLSKGRESKKGTLVTEGDMKKHNKIFFIYSLTYPFLWLIAQLDYLLFFMKGYRLIVKAKKIENV